MADERDPIRDAAHTVIGFAVLGFQRMQVRRRDAEREARSILGSFVRHSSEWLDERDASAD